MNSFSTNPNIDNIDSNNTVLIDSSEENNIDSNDTVLVIVNDTLDYESDLLIVFSCINDTCYFEDIDFPISFLKYYIDTYPPKYYDIKTHKSNYVKYTLIVDKKLSSLLIPNQDKKGSENENINNPINSIL